MLQVKPRNRENSAKNKNTEYTAYRDDVEHNGAAPQLLKGEEVLGKLVHR